ncbi:MAG TPA: TIR domain-containing protein [Verrucomicrobiae bacterium]|nr:TIR domain-containing protein [Verrucomicrobiae bacterium]
MADIFISYANEDKETAARLAGFLESIGWSVWWDRRIPAGRTWRSVLQEALKDMRCMIALWSRDSVESPWVAEEAEEARKLGKTLVPILIQRVEPPIGFRTIQAADLVNWDGSRDDPAAKMLIADLESLLGAPSAKVSERREVVARSEIGPRPAIFRRLKGHTLLAAFAGVAIVSLVVGWQIWTSQERDNRAPRPPAQDDNIKKFTAPRLIGLAVSGERKEIKPSETVKLRVMANFADGTQNDVNDGIEWTSSDPRVATVSEQGEVKGLQAGATSISAKIGDVVSSGWTLGVKAVEPEVKPVAAPKLIALSISSSRSELFTNEKILVRAKGLYSDNSEKLVSNAVDWETSDRTIASIGDQGQLQTLRPGKVEILARSGHLRSKPLAILVKETQTKAQTQAKSIRPVEPQPAPPPILSEQSKAPVLGIITRAKTFREQGNYAAALAELDKAKAIDATNEDVRTEIEQTKRACNAEKVLGNKLTC